MKKKTTLQLCTAAGEPGGSGEPAPDSAAVLKAIREAGAQFQTCIASLEDILEEPLKSKFTQVKGEINKMLAGLPETDKVPAALASNGVLRDLLGILSTAQIMISSLQETAKANASAMASTKASLPGEVVAAIDAKLKAGELLTKADHDQKLADAVASAATAARASAVTELKVLGDRKQLLATASLPVPADELLLGEDKDFTAKKDLAAKRAEELKPFKLASERVLALCWNADEAAYQDTLTLVKQAFEAAGKPAAANPFTKRSGSETQPPAKRTVGLC